MHSHSNKARERKKRLTNRKERRKIIPFDRKYDPKDSIRKVLDLINTFKKMAGYKINIQKSVTF
jgi:hypothetical protein